MNLRTIIGLGALLIQDRFCKSLILWARGYTKAGTQKNSNYRRPPFDWLPREFAVERAEKELRQLSR